MKKIIFVSEGYGLRSMGDEASLLFIVEGLRARIGQFDGVVLARHAWENSYAQYGLRSIQNIDYDSKEESLGKWYYGFNYGDSREHLKRILEEIETSDLIVIGAGEVFADITIDLLRGYIPYFAIIVIMAKMYRKPVMLYGVSLAPFETKYGRDLSRFIIDASNVLTLRNELAAIEVKKLGFDASDYVVLPDPVIGLMPPAAGLTEEVLQMEAIPHGPKPTIAMSIRDMAPNACMDTPGFVQVVASICDRLISKLEGTVIFIPQCSYEHGLPTEDDRYIAELVKHRMTRSESAYVVRGPLSVHQTMALYRVATIAIAARHHANVFAAIAGVPPIAIRYNPKVTGFMKWLNRDKFSVELSQLTPELIEDLCREVLADREHQVAAIASRIAEGRRQVEPYIDIACSLLQTTTNR